MATTVKDRLMDVSRDLGKLERLWTEAIRVVGSAYSEAYKNHSNNLPTQLPPDAHTILIGKVIGAVAGPAAGVLFNPVTAAMATKAIQGELDEFAAKIATHPKPRALAVPNIDTPQKYQNEYLNFISGIFGEFEAKVDWLIEIIDGITKASVQVTHDHVNLLVDLINSSAIARGPSGAANWNNGKALEKEIEIAMWASWVHQLKNATKLQQAAKLDLTNPLKRMGELGLIGRGISGDSGYKANIAAGIVMLKWEKSYAPRRNIIRQTPAAVAPK